VTGVVSIVNKVKNSRIRYLLVGVLVVGLVFGVLSLTYAAETALHDEAPGTIITFSGKQWIILEQMPNGETYILLYDKGSGMAFDPDKTQLFDPSDPNNIAYYLNNDFLNSLSQRHLISEHSWDRVSVNFSDSLDGTDYGNVTCSIGLISYREAEKYSTYYPINYWGWWWTRTPRTESSVTVWCVNRDGSIGGSTASDTNGRVQPSLYLKSNILIDHNKVVVGKGIVNKPDTPAELSANNQSSNEVTLTWQANTEEDLAGYRVYRGTSMIAETALTTYTDNTVLPGMTYIYSISAYNTDDQESERSAPVTVTTPPATPTGLSGNAVERTVTLTWEGPGNPCYIVQRSSNGTDYTQVAEVTEESFTETHDIWGTKYYYRVAQKGQDGNVSAYSEVVQVTTEPVPAPTGLIAAVDGNNINLSWHAVEGVDTYIVEKSIGGENWETIATVTTTTYTDTVEDADIEYLYRVRAKDGDQVSDPSNVAGVALPPSPPDNVQTNVDGKSVTLIWEASGNATAYIIERSADGISWEQITEQSELTYQETAPRWDTSYQYRVKSKNAEGLISVASDPVQVTTSSVPIPENLEASVTDNQITITWDEAPGISLYRIQRSDNSIFWDDLAEVEGTSYTDSDLEWEERYYYRIKSVDGDQESDYTAFIMAQTKPKPVPVAPRLSYSVDNTNIGLAWNTQNVPISGYRIYVNDELKDEIPGNVSKYSFAGESGKSYKVKVEVYNIYGTASSTVTIKVGTFTTPGAAKMVGDVTTNAVAVFGSLGGLLALSLAFKGAGPLIDAARKVIGL
jgi:fibronectin type 3 domain-containing protein